MTIKTIHAGHGGIDPGAVGNGYKEADIARQITDKMIAKTGAFNATDNSAISVNDNLAKIVGNVERVSRSSNDWNISNHLNSASPQATGVEVFYFSTDSEAKQKAEQVSAVIATALGLPNRGAKHGNDLYVIRNTTGKMLLIEWGFISNASDIKTLLANMDGAINEVIKLFGYQVSGTEKPSGNGSDSMSNSKPSGVRANTIGTVKLREDAVLKKTPDGYGELTGQTVKKNDEFKVFNLKNGFYLIGNDSWVAKDACNFDPNPAVDLSMGSLVGKVVQSIYPDILPLYDDPTSPTAQVVTRINNQDKYKVVDEKYVGDRLYLNIGGWNAADYFNIMSQN